MNTITKTSLPSRITDVVLKAPNAGSKQELALALTIQRAAMGKIDMAKALSDWDNEEKNEEFEALEKLIRSKVTLPSKQLAVNYTVLSLERAIEGIKPKSEVLI